ncbi:MAG TPA: peptide chain release factor N(5)-glutamine methyltransferase [Pelomicrobium sp.]|nr:peptide chain release factor N(5)-glutamine methyltransferase [Pelomicrobium sp.]
MTPTVDEALRAAAARIGAALGFDFDTAFLEARVLLAHALCCAPARLVAAGRDPLAMSAQAQFAALVERRAAGEPVAYLTGTREFYGLELVVSPATLIPRPETEQLVDEALARIPRGGEPRIVDAGTGSGAVALAVATARPACFVAGVDASAAALAVAHGNARRLRVSNVGWLRGDWLAAVGPASVDLVVSNPPYVRADDPHLAAGDLRFEPRAALAAGADGLDAVRTLVAGARAALKPGGWLLFEHGFDQGEVSRQLLETARFGTIFTVPDLAGRDRVSGGRRLSG